MPRALLCTTGLAALWLGLLPNATAHEGPPFPIVMDRRAGPFLITVWTHPDVGVGKFYVIIEPAPGTTLPEENKVEIGIQPTSGRLPAAWYTGTRQELRDRVQYYLEVEFDRQEMWRVDVRVSGASGTGEVAAEVEPTPPGYGPWDLLIYGFPFLLFGLLWLCAALRKRRRRSPQGPASGGPASELVQAGSPGPSTVV